MKIILTALTVVLACSNLCFAKDLTQKIDNEKNYVSLNLNSQIKENGSIEKQKIKNKGSWFNININRNTYKFYYLNSVSDRK